MVQVYLLRTDDLHWEGASDRVIGPVSEGVGHLGGLAEDIRRSDVSG